MPKRDPESAYYKGKVDGAKKRKSVLGELMTGTHRKPPSDPVERELYNKGFDEGKKKR